MAAAPPRGDQASDDDQQGKGKIAGPGAASYGAPDEPRLSDRASQRGDGRNAASSIGHNPPRSMLFASRSVGPSR
jgi:hypothetical protein